MIIPQSSPSRHPTIMNSSVLAKNLKQKLTRCFTTAEFRWMKKLVTRFPAAEIYLVGGAVRDAALGRTNEKDYDFVVRNVPATALEQFLKTAGNVDFVGKTFGVFKFYPEGMRDIEAFDIALPRTDHAFGTGGYKAVKVQTRHEMDIEEDLARRDFTANAMAWETQRRLLIDPFDGLGDIAAKRLRAVGVARTRFGEDYSRMLRALRFACELHFTIKPDTWEALTGLMGHLNNTTNGERIVPLEVIAKELLKTFVAEPTTALDLYEESGALAALLPEVLAMKGCPHSPNFHSEGDVYTHTRLALQQLASPQMRKRFPEAQRRALVVIGTLLHDIGKPATVQRVEEPAGTHYHYHGHDKVGAEIASRICQRLKLSTLPRESALHVDCTDLSWIVANHLLLLNAKIEDMRASTIERYFFNDRVPGKALLAVILADSLATIPEKQKKPNLAHFEAMERRIREIRRIGGARRGRYRELPAPLLSGEDLLATFGLEPSQKIGKLLRAIREQQLRGKVKTRIQAIELVRQVLTAEGNHTA